MEVVELMRNKYKAKTDSIFPTYNTSPINKVNISKGEVIKVSKIQYDDEDRMCLVMCKVQKLYIEFIITLEQLTNNFIIC